MTTSRARALTPHLFVRDADAAIMFYRDAFGAKELFRNRLPDGRVLFIEVAVGPARLLIAGQRLNVPDVGTAVLSLLRHANRG